ncbi:hypothetical protein FA15DRAFT_606415, partial [Coprinopsis marcescibilis]
IGFITLDNASNNDTMMDHLELSLSEHNIPFSSTNSCVWYVHNYTQKFEAHISLPHH